MIPVQVKITSYDKARNDCEAELLNGDIIKIDPYVGCAIELSDTDYYKGWGAEIVGNSYLLIEYSVYKSQVIPMENGMILIEESNEGGK